LKSRIGEVVGYRTRFDSKVMDSTRIEVMTEGILTRLIQRSPDLPGVGLVIFDEFHERHLQTDLSLALTLDAIELLRPDLRILIMSATLDGASVAELIKAERVTAEGRSFPVEVCYLEKDLDVSIEGAVSSKAREIISKSEGDILAFLPGAGEIRRTAELLEDLASSSLRILPLFGDLPRAEQDAILCQAPAGVRRVILATSIAESSLTIDGVRSVIDSGWSRLPCFNPSTGMTSLETVRVSRATADQRAGRAGRIGPGSAHRLWSRYTQSTLLPFTRPEILSVDLAPLRLELISWGETEPPRLKWLDPPPAGAMATATSLLRDLGVIDAAKKPTAKGRKAASLPAHPRLAMMLLAASDEDEIATACDLAAMIEERDFLRSAGGRPDADIRLRLDHLNQARHGARQSVPRSILMAAEEWRRRMRIDRRSPSRPSEAGRLLMAAYPDRIGKARGGGRGRFHLSGGRGAFVDPQDSLAGEEWLVAATLDGGDEARIFLAAPILETDLREAMGDRIEERDEASWDPATRVCRAERIETLDRLVISRKPLAKPDPEAIAKAVIAEIRRSGLGILPWSEAAESLRRRVLFLARHQPGEWPDLGDETLTASLDEWLEPWLLVAPRPGDLASLEMATIIESLIPPEKRRRLDEEAPTHLEVPSGSRIRLDYVNLDAPVLAVRLQELFGLASTPTVARDHVSVLIHLLSPARRPIQVTRDLANFWRTTYFEVRKELRGRYPKHSWPDDPTTAPPVRGARRRK
jgi:ATP-dependent helicase HrpB